MLLDNDGNVKLSDFGISIQKSQLFEVQAAGKGVIGEQRPLMHRALSAAAFVPFMQKLQAPLVSPRLRQSAARKICLTKAVTCFRSHASLCT